MEFELVEKEHILRAIEDFKEKGYPSEFGPSSTYDLRVNGEAFSPKAIMAYANYHASGKAISNYFKGGAGTDCFNAFERNGFELIKKEKEDPFKVLIERYKVRISETKLENENYKWKLLQEYNGRPDTSVDDLVSEVKGVKFSNLIYAMGIGVLNKLTTNFPEQMREILGNLFDESRDLKERVADYSGKTLELYRRDEPKLGHHQDERTAATLLAFHDANKYPLYKDSFYSKLCKVLGVKKQKTGEKYVHYKELLNELIKKYILPDQELQDVVNSYLPEGVHPDNGRLILAQDIIYQVLDQAPNEDKQDEELLIKYLKRLGTTKASTFFSLLDEIREFLELPMRDNRICYNLTKGGRLGVTIGQRYCLVAEVSRSVENIFYLNNTKDDSNWLGKTDDWSIVKSQFDDVLAAAKSELFKTTKSGYTDHSSRVLEKAIFNKVYRSELFEHLQDSDYYLLGHNPINEEVEKHRSSGVWEDITKISTLQKIASGTHVALKTYTSSDLVKISKRGIVKEVKSKDGQLIIDWDLSFAPITFQGDSLYLKNLIPVLDEKIIDLIWKNAKSAPKEDYRERYTRWVKDKYKGSGTASSYLRAIDVLSEKLGYYIYAVSDRMLLIELKEDLILHQKDNEGKYFHPEAPSYGQQGYYSASIQSYLDFLDELKKDKRDNKMNLALNTILYGPPGTGKTYKLTNDFKEFFIERKTVKTTDDKYSELAERHSWWEVTVLCMLDLKQAKVPALYNHPLMQYRVALSETKSPKNTLWSVLQTYTQKDCPNVNFSSRKEPEIFWKDENSLWSVDEEVVKEQLPELYEDFIWMKKESQDGSVIERFKAVTFHQSFSYEDFVEGIKPVMGDRQEDLEYTIESGVFKRMCASARKDPDHNYAIFIDEINRGNVASIFGELITLIEDDKREGEKNELSIDLPYSKSSFSVPKNLFIIGTMNTADRSVEALDTALRRRFSFVEMLPNPTLIKEKGASKGMVGDIDLVKLLTAMNRRIEVLVDRDHTIGHAFFMKTKTLGDLKSVVADKIIPLLQEYFYGDYRKMEMVIGSGFFAKTSVEDVVFAIDEESGFEGDVYEIVNVQEMTDSEFKDAIAGIKY